MRKTRFLFPCSLLAILAACGEVPLTTPGGETPSLIVRGEPTGASFGSVGALLFDFDENGIIDGDDLFCSGSLIAPTVFLTAAHCVLTSLTPPGSQFHVSFSPDLYGGGMTSIAATGYAVHPGYNISQADPRDLAVVFLPAGSTAGLTPFNLPAAGALTQVAAQNGLKGQVFYNVGYGDGASQQGIPSFPYDGLRRSSQSVFQALQANWLGLLMNGSATGKGGDCYGDSGGPKFMAGNLTTVVAITITGDTPCRATSRDYRLDTPSARAFLGGYVALP